MTAIAAFHEAQFPTDIRFGTSGGRAWNTTVNEFTDGAEKRNQNWSRARGKWTIVDAVKTEAQNAALSNFWHARRGRAYGFRFKDWSDYRMPFWDKTPGDIDGIVTLFTTDGSTAAFQLRKVYGDGAGSILRDIVKPVAGTLVLFDNHSPATQLLITADYTIDNTTGIVTLSNALKTTSGHAITGYCEFDVPVRFDTDELEISLHAPGIYDFNGLTMVELKY